MPEQTPQSPPHYTDSFTAIREIAVKPGLYLVATPIGNMRDITLRALDTLMAVDVVACEDTRVSGQFLIALGFKKKLIPYHDHNADVQRPHILELIASGKSVALISDAGMPLISDPGYKLVRDCLAAGFYVTSLPGANAPLMAIQLSGLPSDCFSFLGFLPPKTKARRDALSPWKNVASTLILFEGPSRLEDCVADIIDVLGNRPMALTRELTKKFEDTWHGTGQEILERLQRDGSPKGEIVLVVGPGTPQVMDAADVETLLRQAMDKMSLKEAVAEVVSVTGLPKKHIYQQALNIRDA